MKWRFRKLVRSKCAELGGIVNISKPSNVRCQRGSWFEPWKLWWLCCFSCSCQIQWETISCLDPAFATQRLGPSFKVYPYIREKRNFRCCPKASAGHANIRLSACWKPTWPDLEQHSDLKLGFFSFVSPGFPVELSFIPSEGDWGSAKVVLTRLLGSNGV